MTTDADTLIVVNSSEEIPENMTTEEFAAFWDTHTPGPALFEAAKNDPETQEFMSRLRGGQPRQSPRQPRQPRATHITTLRLDEDMEQRLKRVAAMKKIPYQTLLKQFVGERLYEEEKRLGVV